MSRAFKGWHVALHLVGFAMKDAVLLDVDHDIKVTRCTAADARLAVSRRTQSSALPDSRRDFELDSAKLFHASFAAAFLAWLFDDLTGAVAAWTCLRDVKEPTRTNHLSAPGTRRTTCFARAWFGAAAVAFVAGIKLLTLNHLLCAESRLLQLDFHVLPQIRPTTPIVGACPGPAAKERLENSAANPPTEHFAEDFERIVETAAETGTASRERGMTK